MSVSRADVELVADALRVAAFEYQEDVNAGLEEVDEDDIELLQGLADLLERWGSMLP